MVFIDKQDRHDSIKTAMAEHHGCIYHKVSMSGQSGGAWLCMRRGCLS